jgi:hypothetical protein
MELGQLLPHAQLVDQYGDLVDIYDFAQDGRPVVLQLSAGWCYYGWMIGDGLWGDDDRGLAGDYPALFDAIRTGEVHHLTVFVHGFEQDTPEDSAVLDEFMSRHPDASQPAMLDDGSLLPLVEWGFPTMLVLDEDLRIRSAETALTAATSDAVVGLLNEG